MPSNKPRLYIALYPSGVVGNEERKYHWGFLIGPKNETGGATPGVRYHVKNSAFGWKYEEVPLKDVRATNNLLARILIAKIENEQRLITILQSLPVVQNDPNWRCRTWVASALDAIGTDGRCVGTANLDWREIEAVARQYVGQKTHEGRYLSGDMSKAKPTWDMLDNRERIP